MTTPTFTTYYLVLSKQYGLVPMTTVHATEEGAKARIASMEPSDWYVARDVSLLSVGVGDRARLFGVSTPYDDDYTTPILRSIDADRGEIVEVLS